MNILVTGAAGFIGFHLVKKLLETGKNINLTGIDNINDYYRVDMKYARLNESGFDKTEIAYNKPVKSKTFSFYTFYQMDLTDLPALNQLFETKRFDIVVNMAAQAGVRYSIENPHTYIQSNVVGFINILECCRNFQIKHLLYASSSSVYGMNNPIPFREDGNVDYPVSIYAATKKSNELMAYTYSHLYQLPVTGLRFFTVYGPWGRPDMAPMLFADAIDKDRPIKVYNEGNMLRDFTFVEDIVHAMILLLEKEPDENSEKPFYQLFNIGNSHPVPLLDFIKTLEKAMEKKARLEMLPMQPGDVEKTYADTSKLEKFIHYKPTTNLEEGIVRFIDWYKIFSSRITV